eukprot:354314-Chlamydomonas_euryale.AAC.18
MQSDSSRGCAPAHGTPCLREAPTHLQRDAGLAAPPGRGTDCRSAYREQCRGTDAVPKQKLLACMPGDTLHGGHTLQERKAVAPAANRAIAHPVARRQLRHHKDPPKAVPLQQLCAHQALQAAARHGIRPALSTLGSRHGMEYNLLFAPRPSKAQQSWGRGESKQQSNAGAKQGAAMLGASKQQQRWGQASSRNRSCNAGCDGHVKQ